MRAKDLQDDFGAFTSSQTIHRLHKSLYGAGDVVWPASLALARLLVHCPSFVAGRACLEVGAGLGLVGCAAGAAGARSVTVTDRDAQSLALALRSLRLNAPEVPCSALVADFASVPGKWPSGVVDVALCSDCLYDAVASAGVATVLAHLLKGDNASGVPKRALVADQAHREYRPIFCETARALGLSVDEAPLPGPEGCILLNVTVA